MTMMMMSWLRLFGGRKACQFCTTYTYRQAHIINECTTSLLGRVDELHRTLLLLFVFHHCSPRQQVEVVRRWFANYVQLRDGFVLLESGERQHNHDDNNDDDDDDDDNNGCNSFRSFPSMLKGVLRPDGVTRRFKSDRGLYDDDAGIKRRLLQALAKFEY